MMRYEAMAAYGTYGLAESSHLSYQKMFIGHLFSYAYGKPEAYCLTHRCNVFFFIYFSDALKIIGQYHL